MRNSALIPAFFALALAASVGCTKLLGIDKDYVETSSSGTSSSGTGGRTSSSSSTGGSGGHPVVTCTDPTDCPGKENECAHRTCNNGICGMDFTPAGKPVTAQSVGDCKQIVCDGNGNLDQQNDDTDKPDDNNPCTNDVCNSGTPAHTNVASGTSCGGNLTCDGNGKCTGCASPGDCPGQDTECQKRSCTNAVCDFIYTAAGTPVSMQTAGDCKQNVCNGAGQVSTVADNNDPADDGNPCTTDSCSNGSPAHNNAAAGAPCATGVCNGSGACVQCLVPDTCPGQNDECKARTCNAGMCGTSFAPPNTAVSLQAANDCKKNVCDGQGNVTAVPDDTDTQDDGNPCTTDTCSGGNPVHNPVMQGVSCGTNKTCDGQGNCVGCITAADCPGQDNACQSRTCTSGICGFNYVPAGTPVGTQAAGDCKKNACDGSGNTVVMADDSDLPIDGNPCTDDVCSSGTPSNPPSAAGTVCNTTGFCNGAGTCGVCTPGDSRGCCGVKTTACCYLWSPPGPQTESVAATDDETPDLACCCGGTQDCTSAGTWGACY
jgi:hypothetical protein